MPVHLQCGCAVIVGRAEAPLWQGHQTYLAGVDTCLAGPFIAAEAAGKFEAAAALAQTWLAYLAASQARGGMEEPQLVELAVKVSAGLTVCGSSAVMQPFQTMSGAAEWLPECT